MSSTEVAIWERIIHPEGKLTPDTARGILHLSISKSDQKRMQDLVLANQERKLSKKEEMELDDYCRAGRLLSVLKSKARKVLRNTQP
jgi:hypothetical protein